MKLVVGHVRLGEQHVHVAGACGRNGMNRELHFDAALAEFSVSSRTECCACATAMP